MKVNWKRLLVRSLLVVPFVLGFSGRALAQTPELELCIDGSSCISESPIATTPSTQIYAVTLADGWSLDVTVTSSNSPSLGPLFGLSLVNDTVSCTSSSCGGSSNSLDVLLSDTGFSPLVGLVTTFSGTQGNMTSTQLAYFDTSNTDFGTGHEIGAVGPFSGHSFSGTAIDGAPGTEPYSLTIDDIFTAIGKGSTADTNGTIDPTPEPRSMLLMGTGLLAMATVMRRLRRA